MLTQNRLRIMAMKNDFSATGKKYKEALRYYGYENYGSLFAPTTNLIYPMPMLKNSRTLSKQASLPKLPVPSLDLSISKYLSAVSHLISENELENTKKIAAEFIKKDGLGEKLQKKLVERSKSTENWLSQWWLDKIYLEPRYSLLISCNPGSLYPKASYKTLDEQLIFATKYICGFLDFKKYLEDQKLAPEKLGESFLCMDQYYKLFGTCRIPNKNKDDIKVMQVYNIDLNKCNHIIVMYKKRIFSLKIIDHETGFNYSPHEIYNNLKALVEKTDGTYGPGLGILTASEDRDAWFDAYSKLKSNATNNQNFEQIHNSFFVLCLDDKEETVNNQVDTRSWAAGQMLHGNKKFTPNRWFDKTIQVIIGDNGIWGINFEHSIAEAVPHAVMQDYIYNYLIANENSALLKTTENKSLFNELNFEITQDIQIQIDNSAKSINKMIDDLEMYILNFDVFGKNFPKSQKISPDAFVQLAIQLAFYRNQNKLANCYESGSLRKFSLGRTEIIRTCSKDACEFVKSMTDNTLKKSQSECAKLLLNAINSHRLYTNNVINMMSFDRHLLGLKLIASENNIELPEIYKDVSYKKLSHFYLSTSQVSSKTDAVTFYGPLVSDGYGCCYSITEKKLLFGLSSLNSCPTTSAKEFGNDLQNALIDCQNLLLKVSQSKL